MIPKLFQSTDARAIFTLIYADRCTSDEVLVRMRDDLRRGEIAVIEIEYPTTYGAGLRIGRIEQETEDQITFRVHEPQVALLDGTVILTRTGSRWE
jgi:hypothetical protein